MHFNYIHTIFSSFPLFCPAGFYSDSPLLTFILLLLSSSLLLILSLGLDSAYKYKCTIFVFQSLTYLAVQDELQFNPYSCKGHSSTILYDYILFIALFFFFTYCLSMCWLMEPWLMLLWAVLQTHGHSGLSIVSWPRFLQIYAQEQCRRMVW
jgi:hypothetical protein